MLRVEFELMVKELALPQGIGNFMSLEVRKPPSKISAEPQEKPLGKETGRRALEFFGWDVDGTTVDTMKDFERINVEVAMATFGRFGLSETKARRVYREDPSRAGTKYILRLGELYTCDPAEEHMKLAVVEVKNRLSKQLGPAIPGVSNIMTTLNDKGITQFVCSNAYKADVLRKLEHADLLQFLDPNAIVGSDSGEKDQILKKGRPQLRRVSKYLTSKGLVNGYRDFVTRAGYFGDMVRDMEEMIPCNLRFLIGFADVASSSKQMWEVGADLPMDRFRVVTAKTIRDVLSYIDIINYREAANYPGNAK